MSEPIPPYNDDDLTVDLIHTTRRSLLEWIQLSKPDHRSRTLLSSLPTDTLRWGLKWLRNYISHLVEQDNRLYREFLELVPKAEWSDLGRTHHSWHWEPPREETVEGLARQEVLGFLLADVGVYDEVMQGIIFWKSEIERLKRERISRRMDLEGPVFNDREI